MALSEIERAEKSIAAFLERRRPPPEIRNRLDLGYRIDGHNVELFEVRPVWKDPSKKHKQPVAKAIFVRTRISWKVNWMRQDLKWHGYTPAREVKTLDGFLSLVDKDEHCCFFG